MCRTCPLAVNDFMKVVRVVNISGLHVRSHRFEVRTAFCMDV